MLFKFISIASVIASLCGNGCSFVFDVEFDDEMKPCAGKEKLWITSIVDISKAELFRLSETQLMANGTFIILKQYSKDQLVSVIHIEI